MTASVAPRMRVDNRVTVYTYYGTQVGNKPYQELRSACWRPRPLVWDSPSLIACPNVQVQDILGHAVIVVCTKTACLLLVQGGGCGPCQAVATEE